MSIEKIIQIYYSNINLGSMCLIQNNVKMQKKTLHEMNAGIGECFHEIYHFQNIF